MNFIRLTHLRTGKPTYINVDEITCVRESIQGETLVLFGKQGQYVAEPIRLVVDTVESLKAIKGEER